MRFGKIGQLTLSILTETTGVPVAEAVSVFVTSSCTSMKPHRWHLTTGPSTVTFVTTFFASRVSEFVLRASARASPTWLNSTAEQKRAVNDERSTAVKAQREALDVQVVARDARVAEIGDDVVDHRDRAADVDVALGDVGDELLQVGRREQVAARRARVVADDVVDLDPAPRDDLLQLGPEDDVAVGDDAVKGDDVAVHLLEQRANRSDADPACDQERLVDGAAVLGEDPERPLGEYPCPDRDLPELGAVVAEVLDGDPERVALGRLRERIRMLRVPEAFREEPPEEELAGLRVELVEVATGDPQRDDPGGLLDHVGDPQAEAERVDDRPGEPVPEDERQGARVERPPVVGGRQVEVEVVAVRDHVEPRERDPRVGGEVDRVPPLVGHPPPDDDERGDEDDDE